MAFTFRFATEEDLPKIVEIENAAMSCPWSLKSYQEALESDHAFIMVAQSEDFQVAGFCVFYLTPPEAELPDVVISEEYRGNGLGRQLLSNAFTELRSRDVETVFLEVRVSNAPARTLYDHLGFEEIGVRKYFYTDPVEDAICMRIDLI